MEKTNKQQDTILNREEKNDFNKTNIQTINKKDSSYSAKFERVELMTTNFLFSIMIILTTIGTFLIILKLDEFLKPLKELNPEYEFPSIYDFKITLLACPIVIVRKFLYHFYSFEIENYLNSNS